MTTKSPRLPIIWKGHDNSYSHLNLDLAVSVLRIYRHHAMEVRKCYMMSMREILHTYMTGIMDGVSKSSDRPDPYDIFRDKCILNNKKYREEQQKICRCRDNALISLWLSDSDRLRISELVAIDAVVIDNNYNIDLAKSIIGDSNLDVAATDLMLNIISVEGDVFMAPLVIDHLISIYTLPD